ncbi:MAG: hypothetical protein CR988_06145 [Treponema sp.]|nr:MAG: hypothetical protein CR988_06145 [Treponema sp.]
MQNSSGFCNFLKLQILFLLHLEKYRMTKNKKSVIINKPFARVCILGLKLGWFLKIGLKLADL